ncbi:acyltransferase family protein [Sinomonas sp. G460-2]|uniref:acyltransferase family protein n=1 Tax=Sinomonas sp. G460-2 TaxID=3393464 RepID=UPI0039F13B6B
MQSTPIAGMHLRSLTGLRFYAAIAVVAYHFYLYFSPLGRDVSAVAYGFTGVSFFFILSGFVLAWAHQDGDRPTAFYWNRFARVWPLHALTTLLAIFAPPISEPTTVWPALPFVLTLTQSWTPIGGYMATTFNGVSWSLSCETFFYLLFPALIGALGRQRRLPIVAVSVFGAMTAVAIFMMLALPGGAANYLLGTIPLYRLGEFIVGVSLAVILKRGWRPPFTLGHAAGLAAVLYMFLLAASFITSGTPGDIPVIYANLTMAPGFVAIIAAAAANDIEGRAGALGSTTMVRLGRWSFALYLIHELVIRTARPLVDGLAEGWAFAASVVVAAVAVALSGVLHEFVERPVERLLRSWGPLRKPAAASVPAESQAG